MAGPQVFEGPNSAVFGRPTHDSGSALGAYNSSPGLEAVTDKRHITEEAVDDRIDGTVLDIYAKILSSSGSEYEHSNGWLIELNVLSFT